MVIAVDGDNAGTISARFDVQCSLTPRSAYIPCLFHAVRSCGDVHAPYRILSVVHNTFGCLERFEIA